MSRGESVPQKPIIGSYSTHTEIEERDQANNVVATYVCSPDSGPQERGRVDVVVCMPLIEIPGVLLREIRN